MSEPTFVPLGEPLAPSEAAYLQHEVGKRGIEARLRSAAGAGAELVVVEVHASDLPAGVAVRRELLETKASPGSERAPQGAGSHRRALLAAASGAVAVLYLGRPLAGALRGALAVVVGAVVYVVMSRRRKNPCRE